MESRLEKLTRLFRESEEARQCDSESSFEALKQFCRELADQSGGKFTWQEIRQSAKKKYLEEKRSEEKRRNKGV
jgi:hypothetical protein